MIHFEVCNLIHSCHYLAFTSWPQNNMSTAKFGMEIVWCGYDCNILDIPKWFLVFDQDIMCVTLPNIPIQASVLFFS